MSQPRFLLKFVTTLIVSGGMIGPYQLGWAQDKPATLPDAQVEANVLKALAGSPQLADQSISTTTVFGTVTITGSVRDEASRDLAEHVVCNTPGVRKVIDELTIGAATSAANDASQEQEDSEQQGSPATSQTSQTVASNQQQQGDQQGDQQQNDRGPVEQPRNQQPVYRDPYGRPYGRRPLPAYQQQDRGDQRGGEAVIVPAGTALRVRLNDGIQSKTATPGMPFEGVVLSDVVAGGFVAIPRGAEVQGSVVEVRHPGQFRGQGMIVLKLTQVTLGGRTYPITSNFWSHEGIDKTGNTVGNTVGIGATGALIGAIAGGGPGAAIGAGVGSVVGLGVSSASRRGETEIPPEAIVNFRLTQPTELTTVSQSELNRLGSGLPGSGQPMMQRIPLPPPRPPAYYPYPYYYGPVMYPRY